MSKFTKELAEFTKKLAGPTILACALFGSGCRSSIDGLGSNGKYSQDDDTDTDAASGNNSVVPVDFVSTVSSKLRNAKTPDEFFRIIEVSQSNRYNPVNFLTTEETIRLVGSELGDFCRRQPEHEKEVVAAINSLPLHSPGSFPDIRAFQVEFFENFPSDKELHPNIPGGLNGGMQVEFIYERTLRPSEGKNAGTGDLDIRVSWGQLGFIGRPGQNGDLTIDLHFLDEKGNLVPGSEFKAHVTIPKEGDPFTLTLESFDVGEGMWTVRGKLRYSQGEDGVEWPLNCGIVRGQSIRPLSTNPLPVGKNELVPLLAPGGFITMQYFIGLFEEISFRKHKANLEERPTEELIELNQFRQSLIGTAFPELTIKDIDLSNSWHSQGNRNDLFEVDENTLVIFMSLSCNSCIRSLPVYEQIGRENGLKVITLLPPEDVEYQDMLAKNWPSQRKVYFGIMTPQSQEYADTLTGGTGYPLYVLVGKDGHIVDIQKTMPQILESLKSTGI